MRTMRCLAVSLAASFWCGPALAQPAPKPAPPLDPTRLSTALTELARRVRPSVVQILATGYATAAGGLSPLLTRQRGTGTGVIVDAAGYVVTNAHVVQGAHRIQVILPGPAEQPSEPRSVLKAPGRTLGAELVGMDQETDLAVLRLSETGLPALSLGDSEGVQQGELVLAFGSPLGLADSVSLGVVSTSARQIRPDDPMIYIQTDASINPGNSGGPLVDIQGRLVGINTLILSQSGGSEGVGFAAPSNIVRNVFEQIKGSGRVRRGEIGVRAQTLTPALAAGLGLSRDWGVVLADVRPEGPGARAGLAIGDIVVSLDGKAMENARQLDVNLYRRAPGEVLSLGILRGKRSILARVDVIERSGDADQLAGMVTPDRNLVPALGILGLDVDERVLALIGPLRAPVGVVVAASSGEQAVWQDSLKAGDVIHTLNQEPVSNLAKLRELLSAQGPGSTVILHVERAGGLRYIAYELE
jgi:serine protease Do